MIPSNLKNWPIFSVYETKFISTICKAFVYGDSGNQAIIVTKNGMVYALKKSSFELIKIERLCKINIKTLTWFRENLVLVLTEMKELYGWDGDNLTKFSGPDHWLNIACGANYCFGLTWTGNVCKFEHIHNTNGYYNNEAWSSHKQDIVISDKGVTHISCGNSHNIVVTHDRKVYSWGDNRVGQLGIKDKCNQNKPVKVTQLENIIIEKIACGYAHTIALSNKDGLYVWGANDYNELGFSTNTYVPMPVKLVAPLMGKVIDIAASRHSHISVAMASDRRIFIWGKCLNQIIKVPTLTRLQCLHDAFACFACPRVMHEPLLIQKTTHSNLVDSFEKFFDDPNTSDLIFQVGGKPIHVHKTILKIRCSYFRTMFQGEWRENSQRVIEHEVFSYETYRAFLKYLYTDKIDVPSSTAQDLLFVADIYNEDEMKRLCVRPIKETMTVDTVASVYKTSIDCHVKELEEYCFNFALRHMTEVVQTPAFMDLNEITIKDFIMKAAKAGAFKT